MKNQQRGVLTFKLEAPKSQGTGTCPVCPIVNASPAHGPYQARPV